MATCGTSDLLLIGGDFSVGSQSVTGCGRHVEKDRQCTYDVTLRSARVALLQWKSYKNYTFQVCVCSLRYPACNTHAPHCHLRSVRLCNIFLTLSHNQQAYRMKLLSMRPCFEFLYNFRLKSFSFWTELSEIWSKTYTGLHVKSYFN